VDNREYPGECEIIFAHGLTIIGLSLETRRGGLSRAKVVGDSRERLLCFKFTAFNDCLVGEMQIGIGGNSYWVSGLNCPQCNGSCAASVKRKCDGGNDRQGTAGKEKLLIFHDVRDFFNYFIGIENFLLSTEMTEGVFHRCAGYLEHPLEGAAHIQN
jgi:hypothetical protein